MLNPHLLDQKMAFENQFEGMASEDFSYEDYEKTRIKLIEVINQELTQEDKKFLLSFKNLTPDWSIYPFSEFPGVKWKQLNLNKLKNNNPKKHKQLFDKLKEVLKVYINQIKYCALKDIIIVIYLDKQCQSPPSTITLPKPDFTAFKFTPEHSNLK